MIDKINFKDENLNNFAQLDCSDSKKLKQDDTDFKNKSKKPQMFKILIIINVLVYILMVFSSHKFTFSTKYLLKCGALYPFIMVFDHQWYRMITNMFIHSSFDHLLGNMISLYWMGQIMENVFGKYKFLLFYIISGFFSSVFSFCFTDYVSVGASGAVFGVFGMNIALYFINSDIYKKIFHYDVFILLAINLIIGFINPVINQYAHIGGLLAGFLIALSYSKTVTNRIYEQVKINLNYQFNIEKRKNKIFKHEYISILFLLIVSIFMMKYRIDEIFKMVGF